MNKAEKYVIPTLSKAKISHHLSYPVGAEKISDALASVPQLLSLKLHFYSHFDLGLRRGYYEFLRIEYLNGVAPAAEYPLSELYSRPPQYRWEVIVQPVPRLLRRRIREYVIDSALPQITRWLNDRSVLHQKGSDILAFFYDEKENAFVAHTLTRLEPLRG